MWYVADMSESGADGWLPLWSDGDPVGVEHAAFYPYPSGKEAAGTIVVFPGGGYKNLAEQKTAPVCRWLNGCGLDAMLVRYRLGPTHRHPAPLQDAARAVRLVRARGHDWGLSSRRVGVAGKSAGGHLASTLAVHHGVREWWSDADDLRHTTDARPDVLLMAYPVIDMAGPASHGGSAINLLGEGAADELRERLSTHRHVTADTPPTFTWHSADDTTTLPANSWLFAQACINVGVPMEMHVFERGGHGGGVGHAGSGFERWTDLAGGFVQRHL